MPNDVTPIMPVFTAIENQILNVLRNQLIPWANAGAPFILLSPPPQAIGTNIITEHDGTKLPLQRGGMGKKVHAQFWRDENLNAVSVPYMGCVVDGEADITLGTTTAMCRKLKIPGKRWILQATQKSFFLAPPYYPVSSGGGVHWERAHPEKARSRIFWMQFYPTGVLCHFCSCEKGKHWNHPDYFVAGPQMFALAKNLITEMTEQAPQYVPLVYFNLGILLNVMVRNLLISSGQEQGELDESPQLQSYGTDPQVQKAIDYIGEHLASRLMTVEKIAEQVQLSPRHFARLFKQRTGTTVMDFVFARRMERAERLLIESTFSVKRVATSCGYVSAAPFIKAFNRHFHISPTEYRARNQWRGSSG